MIRGRSLFSLPLRLSKRLLRELQPVAFWTKPVRAEPLAAFRILLGSTLFLSVLFSFLPRLGDYSGPEGLCSLEAAEPWLDRTHRVCLLRGPQHVPFLEDLVSAEAKSAWRTWGDRPENVRFLAVVWLSALAMMTFGLGTRFSTLVAWALTISFHSRFSWVNNGGDSLARLALFYLLIGPAGRIWSLDAAIRTWIRRKRGTFVEGPVLVPAWSVRLAQIQFVAIYFFTGLYKVWAEGWGWDWLDGSAVYWMLNDIALTRWPYGMVPVPMWLCRAMSWGTLAFELGFPLFVLCRWTRPVVLVGGVLFHLGIMMTVEIGWFSPISLSWYPLFLSGERLQRFRRYFR